MHRKLASPWGGGRIYIELTISAMLVRNSVIEKNAATSRRISVIFASVSLYVFIMLPFCSFCKHPRNIFRRGLPNRAAPKPKPSSAWAA
ncbi:hypothetical protein JET14_07805 [Martelella lutilitoris]|uniref:Uncharacterized protein n=1 Tax=Martelella lutilitoris TaxID=2583532 RepID=A0A7T7KMP4_9HYPH|nr:hypothetical protein [Martelella lutilitoris]QQM32046.1 hypothetical protein JET14_07805 [Martelella lutilitoris]